MEEEEEEEENECWVVMTHIIVYIMSDNDIYSELCIMTYILSNDIYSQLYIMTYILSFVYRTDILCSIIGIQL